MKRVWFALGDFSTQSDQPLMKHQIVTVVPASAAEGSTSVEVGAP